MRTHKKHLAFKTYGLRILLVVFAAAVLGGCGSWKSSIEIQEKVNQMHQEAKSYFEHGEFEKGAQLLEKAMEMQPNCLELANTYRAEMVKQNQEERSIAFFKKLVEKKNAPDEAYFNLAFAYIDKIPRVGPMGAGFLSKRSIAQFRTVLDQEKDNWIANYGIGMNYQHWPDYFEKNESSLSYFEKCLELQKTTNLRPYHILTHIRLGDGYVRSGEIKKAIEIWQEGLRLFPNHPDLEERLQAGENRIATLIQELYNPNNSIGAIDTDISILWVTEVPEAAAPLYVPVKSQGIGGQLKTAPSKADSGELGLFGWFQKNFPFLSDRRFHSHVDMSLLGITQGEDAADANTIAHAMILGFLSQFEEETAEQINEKASRMDGFMRPFYHEGLGMGFAASLDTDDSESFQSFIQKMDEIDPNFIRLHLAGAGMWFGLETSTKIETVMRVFDWLGPFGSAYAYEGFGFAQALFHFKRNPELMKLGEKLPPLAAQCFYHGAGRAFWIMSGSDLESFEAKLAYIPQAYKKDVYSGYGMGVSFTKTDETSFVFSFLNDYTEPILGRTEFLTGVAMGYTIRYIADAQYINNILASTSGTDQYQMNKALDVGQKALEEVYKTGGDFHSNWRSMIRQNIKLEEYQ
jgi:tetratricopeptide (TPR) repeat protein